MRESLEREAASAQAADSGAKALHTRLAGLTKNLGQKVSRQREIVFLCVIAGQKYRSQLCFDDN